MRRSAASKMFTRFHRILLDEKCIDPNEFFRVGINPCGNLCKDINRPCDNYAKKPVGGCDCKDGYARLRPEDKCIRIDDPRCQAANHDPPIEHLLRFKMN